MKVIEYRHYPSQGIKEFKEFQPAPNDFCLEGVCFDDIEHPKFIRNVWFRNRSPRFECLLRAFTETPLDQQQQAEVVAEAIAFLLKKTPPEQVFFLNKQQLQDIQQSN